MEETVTIPPGVVATPTKEENTSNWREVNFVRWDNGVMEPIGGWERYAYTAPASNLRRIFRWRDLTGREWVAFVCEGHVYVEFDEDLFDVSPVVPIEAPSADFTAGGYGDDEYSLDDYGDARASRPGEKSVGAAFSVSNWGENLEVMISSDGRLLEWVPPIGGADPDPMEEVVDSPSGFSFVVTPERHIMIFQAAGVFNQFAWCDQEDNTNWEYADITSKAGNYLVEPASPIAASISAGDNGVLFFTTVKAYVTRWVGLPDVYTGGDDIADGVTPVSPQAIERISEGAMWFTENGPWRWDGANVYPVPCDIWAWIKKNINWTAARHYSFCVNMTTKSELWYFFPTTVSDGNDRAAIYNYRSGWWSMARIARTAGFNADFIGYPILGNGTYVYQHDSGDRYADSAELPWAESFNFSIKGGANLSMIRQIEPTVVGEYEGLNFSLAKSLQRTPDIETYSTPRYIQDNGRVDFMESVKDVRLRIAADGPTVKSWTVGPILLDFKVKGKHK